MEEPIGFCGDDWPWEAVLEKFPEKGTLLEVGAGLGLSTSRWAKNLPNFKIHTVDIAEGGQFPGKFFTAEEQLKSINEVVQKYENLSFTKGDFAEVKLPKMFETPDVFFYDGHHGLKETRDALFRFHDTNLIIVDDCQFDWVKKEVLLFAEKTSRNFNILKTKNLEVAVIQ